MELDKKYGNRYAELYNIAAKAIKKKYPDKLIGFIAYGHAKRVPRNIKMEDNILVEVCNIGNTNSFVDYAKWKAVGIKHFGLYDYLYPFGGGGYITHRYYPRYLTEIWRREFKKFPVKSMWLEYYPRTLIFDAPRQYVLDEYAWNNDVDVEALLKDYFSAMYGSGADAVQHFMDAQEKILARRKPGTMWSDAGVAQYRVYTAADVQKLDKLLADAEKYFSGSDIYAKRFHALKKAWELSRLYIQTDLCIRDINAGKNLIDTLRLGYETVAKLNSFSLTRDEERAVFTGKASLQSVRSALTRIKPDVLMDKAADRQLNKLTAQLLKKHSKAAVAAQYRAAVAKSADPAFRRIILTQVWQLENRGKNILSNPGFESSRGKKAQNNNPSDWTGFRGVPGWYTWRFPDSVVDFRRVSKDVHSGKFAAAIGRNQVNGGICTSVPLEPGCRYRVSCYVKRNDNNKGGRLGGFGIRLVGPGGKWLDSGSAIGVTLDERCIGKWQKYEVAFTAPDMPASALFIFSAPVQGSASLVIFDDVVFEKIYDPMNMKSVKPFAGDPQVDEAMRWGAPLFNKLTGAEIVPVKWQLKTKGAFFCRVKGKKLYIFGDAEGVRCGIYRVLQKLGVHWFSPGEKMIIPAKAAMPFAKLDRFSETPSFPYRSLHICSGKHHYDETVARWMSFNCMNGKLTHLPEDDIVGGELKKLGLAPDTTVHAYDLMIPANKYYKSNPEFFALVGNKRITGGGQLCVSNEKMREAFVKELYALIKAKPHIGVYGICPNDGYGWCE
ncbi:MAG: DUF4838 domain-containing protein, partial [Lentisphaeria bacterium]|nr:DUF4838 domain-containing protein [Lentisphaeria bacterium]